MKIEYFGIVVKDLVVVNELYILFLGEGFYKVEEVESEKVVIFFF